MTATVAGIHGGLDTHANRPAGNTVPDGSLYSCSTHGLIYKSNLAGNSWATYATLGAAASGSITASGYTQSTAKMLGRSTAATGAIEEITVGSGLSLAAGSLTATGGGLTQAYVGYNTIGGSVELITQRRMYMKKVTLANDCLLTNIEGYLNLSANSQVRQLAVALFADSAGAPTELLAVNDPPATSIILSNASTSPGRWFGLAIGTWLAAGDYWMGIGMMSSDTGNVQLAYDGSGTDRYYTESGSWISDAQRTSVTTGSLKYSIRGNTIR